MNLKQFVENHAIVILFVTLVTGFAAGWGAYVAVQNAAGLTSVSNDHLKELERRAAFGREELERENGIYRERIASLETENKKIQDALLKNRPRGNSYITNVSLTPKSPATLAINNKIIVNFDYVIAEDEEADIRVEDTTLSTKNSNNKISDKKIDKEEWVFVIRPGNSYSGKGSATHSLDRSSPGSINEITIYMQSEKEEDLFQMKLPVKYTFK